MGNPHEQDYVPIIDVTAPLISNPEDQVLMLVRSVMTGRGHQQNFAHLHRRNQCQGHHK